MTKARHGCNAGGRCYGYDNFEVREGERRVRAEYAINPEQANLVREIELYAAGVGTKKDRQTRRAYPCRQDRTGGDLDQRCDHRSAGLRGSSMSGVFWPL